MQSSDDVAVCECSICSLNLPFDFDPHLTSEIEKHNCVIFSGAGVSTETGDTHPDTLYEQIQHAVECFQDLDFPKLVDLFENQPNGRQKFIELVRKRFDYIDSFRDLKFRATRFHTELSDMPYFHTYITTNWDRYFEDELGATPFVYDYDMPFWDTAKRPLLKIHGSIDNYSSIVASSEDYVACETRLREGALGAALKQIFATKTIIFCGYSASDQDFLNIYKTISSGLGKFARTHYLISPFLSESQIENFKKELNIVAIKTDATNFLTVVRNHMENKFCFSKKESKERIIENLIQLHEAHNDFVASYNPFETPHLMFSTVYQDGLIHAFQRILDQWHTGQYADLHYIRGQSQLYDNKISQHLKKKDYREVSYFTGYQTGLIQFDMINSIPDEDVPELPHFFHPGAGWMCKEQFDDEVRNFPEVHKGAYKQAKRLMARLGTSGDVVLQHMPWG